MALQLKIGDLTLTVIETWGEAVDWPTRAAAIPGNWAGIMMARKPEPRSIRLSGFIGQDAADLLAQHRSDYSDFVAALNDLTRNSRRTDDGLWELWHEGDRYIRVLPVSFVPESEGNVSWATRFTCQLIAADPRWYSSSWSTSQPTLVGSSNWHSIALNNYGDAPTNPAIYYQLDAGTAVTFTNRRRNVIANALFREGVSATAGVPKAWTGDTQVGVAYQHIYRRFYERWGRAYINLLSTTGNDGQFYQDIKVSESGSVWSLSAVVRTLTLTGTTPEFHIRMRFLGSNGVSLAVADSATITTDDTESTLTVLNQTAPVGTHYIRVYFMGSRQLGDSGRAYCRAIQLERGAVNTTFEYQAHSTMTFQWTVSELTDLWIDSREQQSSYLTIATSQDPRS